MIYIPDSDSPIMSAEAALTPSVTWAQRPKIVFVTINVSDVENPDIKVIHSMDDNHVKTITYRCHLPLG